MSRATMIGAARAIPVVLGLILCLTLSHGSAAVAAFSNSGLAVTQYSTATLAAPSAHSTNISMSCIPGARTVTVRTFGQVAKANYHELKIYVDSNPVPLYTGELKKQGQTVLTIALGSGSWRAEIRGQYRIEGSSNAWTGPALTVPLVCK